MRCECWKVKVPLPSRKERGKDGAPAMWKTHHQVLACVAMFKATVLNLSVLVAANATELPSKKYLNLSAIKTMVAAAEAEAEAQRHNVQVTICVVDESGNLLFLEKRL